MSNEEQIGFHKGALTTLAKEREELIRMVQIVEQLIKMHIDALKKLGVDIEKEAKEAQELLKKSQQPKEKDEDIADKLA